MKFGGDEEKNKDKKKQEKSDPFTDFFSAIDNGINMYAIQNRGLKQRFGGG